MYSGIIPPLVTPIKNSGNVCEESVKRLINHVASYSKALMPCLSSGEGWALNEQQWMDMVKYCTKYSDLPCLAGIELKTTDEVIERAKKAKSLGIETVVVTTPFLQGISQQEIYSHFKRIKNEVNIRVFLYNEQSISGNAIEYETIIRICNLGNIVGIKEASGSAEFTARLVNAKLGVPIFQGWENLCHESLGVQGYILPLSNLEPGLCSKMLENPSAETQREIDSACDLYKILGSDWYSWMKKELHDRGIISTDLVIKKME